MADENQLSRSQMIEASGVAEALLTKILEGVPRSVVRAAEKRGGAAGEVAEQRLFFPNGIELISVIVKFGGANVEAKIAGSATPDVASAAPAISTAGLTGSMIESVPPGFIICCGSGSAYHGGTLTWANPTARPIRIYFPGPCPLNVNNFVVPASGTYVTQVVVNGGSYEYVCSPATEIKADNEAIGRENPAGGGNPRVIIM